jgi:DNA polymerase III alpha subunit (gram-positive type)
MIAIDTEYIAEDSLSGETPGPRPNVEAVYCEIMQIGACKLDNDGKEIGTLNITVKAHRIPMIPRWLVTMTGMTEEKRAEGKDFKDALAALLAFVGDDTDIWTFNGDWFVLQGNIKSHQLINPFPNQFKRTKPQLAELGVTSEMFESIGSKEMNSGNLYKVLNIELLHIEGVGAHDACHDARSLAYSMYHLLNR